MSVSLPLGRRNTRWLLDCLGMSTAVHIQRGWYQPDSVPFECGISTLGKEYAILLKTKTETETRIKTMIQKKTDGLDPIEAIKLYGKKPCGKPWSICHNGYCYLFSHSTKVAKFNLNDGKLVRLWDGYSQTTMCHINEWLQLHWLPTITKKQWEGMEVVL